MSSTDDQFANMHRKDAAFQLFEPYHRFRAMSGEAKVLALIFTLLAIWGGAIASFGIVALLVPMKVLVPLAFVMLFLLTWRK